MWSARADPGVFGSTTAQLVLNVPKVVFSPVGTLLAKWLSEICDSKAPMLAEGSLGTVFEHLFSFSKYLLSASLALTGQMYKHEHRKLFFFFFLFFLPQINRVKHISQPFYKLLVC